MSRGSRWDFIFGSTYKGRVQLGPQPATRLRTKREGLGVQGSWDKVTLGQAADITEGYFEFRDQKSKV